MGQSNEEKRIQREWRELFESPGWQRFIKEKQEELDAIPTVAFYSAKDLDELVAYRVRARLLGEVIAQESIVEKQNQERLMELEQEEEDKEQIESLKHL